jgi:hypothetical protein
MRSIEPGMTVIRAGAEEQQCNPFPELKFPSACSMKLPTKIQAFPRE